MTEVVIARKKPVEITSGAERQKRTAIKKMASSVIEVAREMIKEYGLSKTPRGYNFAWQFFVDPQGDVEPPLSATTLDQAIKYGYEERVTIDFSRMEEELSTKYGGVIDAPHFLTVDFLIRMGIIPGEQGKPDSAKDFIIQQYRQQKTENLALKTLSLSDPKRPFNIECNINGSIEMNYPRLNRLTLIYAR